MGLRALFIAAFFFLGLGLVIFGWTLKGQLSGLGLMVAGVPFSEEVFLPRLSRSTLLPGIPKENFRSD